MSLIGWWPLDGSTEDYTVNQNHGVNNNVTWVNGKIGQAGSFNGTTSKITVSQVDLLSEWSVSVWIKPVTSTKTYQFLFGNNVVTGNIGRILIRYNGYVAYSYPVNTYKNFSLLTADIIGSWNHLVFVANNTGIDLYLNGVYNSRVSQIDPILNFAMIGNAWNDDYWATEGQINDVRIYNHALSQKEINDLAKAKVLNYSFNKDEAIIYDETGYKRNTILSENKPVWTNNVKNGSGGYLFDGISNKLTLNPDPLGDNFPKDFTISLWTKGFIRPSEFTYIIHRGESTSISDSVIYIGVQNSGYFSFGVNGSWVPGSTTVMQDPNLWYHLVLRYSGTTVTGFINGQQSVSYTSNITNTAVGTYTSIGNSTIANSNRAYNGIITDVQFYSTALSNTDILDLYQTKIKVDNQGNLYANEIVEDYEIKPGLTLRELFEDKNMFIGESNYNEQASNYIYNQYDGESHTLTRTATGYTMFGDPVPVNQYVEPNDIIYAKYDYLSATENNGYFRVWLRRATDNLDGIDLYFIASSPGVIANTVYRNGSSYVKYTGTSTLVKFNFISGTGVIGAVVTLKGPFVVNLTKIFGAGYEPTKDQMDTWYKDYITSRPKSSGIMKTREFSEIDNPNEPMKIFKDKIQIQGSIKEV